MSAPRRRLPVVDLSRSVAEDQAALEAAAVRVLRSGRFVLGPEVSSFEHEAASFLGSAHAVGVSSGTDALYLALRACGVGPGDDVLVPVFGFVATVEAVARAGAHPVFVDVRAGCGRADLADAARRITARARAFVHVALGGDGGGAAEAALFCAEHGLTLLEDAAQSFGARDGGRAVGTFGRLGAYSFFPAKVLGGFGDGGLVVTDDESLAALLRSLRQHGRTAAGHFAELGANARLDELQAALLRVRLASLPRELIARGALAAAYDHAFVARGLAERVPCEGACTIASRAVAPLVLPARCTPGHANGLYTVRLGDGVDRERVRRDLAEQGIDSAVHYGRLLVDEGAFSSFVRAQEEFPGARDLAARTLSLPFFVGMGDEDVTRVVEALAAALPRR